MLNYYSFALKKFILPFADKLMKTEVNKFYKLIEILQNYTPHEIKKWQNQRLKDLIHHAYHNTVYYKKLFDNLNISTKVINTIVDLKRLPVLTKEIIKNSFHDIQATDINNYPFNYSSTGGSSGDPLKYLLDNKSWSYSVANTIFNWEKSGFNYGDKYIALGSSSLFVNKKRSIKHSIYYKLKNKISLNGVNMSDRVCSEYINLVQDYNIKFIYGYASSIYLLAKYAAKKNINLDLIACFPTSEILTEKYRQQIQYAFQCQIIDCYGANDGGITAFEHIPGYFEVGYNCVFVQENTDSDGIGSILLTDLFNYAMPLINYKLGDVVQVNEKVNNDYKYNGQIINKVLGRSSDIIELENGNILTGPGFTILFKDLPVEYYFIEKLEGNSIKCSIMKLPEYSKSDEDVVRSTLKKQAGQDSEIIIDYINEITLSKSGKRKYFKTN